MIDTEYVRLMARYNAWQNSSLFDAAARLEDAARRQDRGAFFGSIHGTLSHLLWADRMWLSRFCGQPKPAVAIADSPGYVAAWDDLAAERAGCDAVIGAWAAALDPAWLAGDIAWHSGALGRDMRQPAWFLVSHFFNHQTHHRGQVHAMLTAAGARPGPTDLIMLAG